LLCFLSAPAKAGCELAEQAKIVPLELLNQQLAATPGVEDRR